MHGLCDRVSGDGCLGNTKQLWRLQSFCTAPVQKRCSVAKVYWVFFFFNAHASALEQLVLHRLISAWRLQHALCIPHYE